MSNSDNTPIVEPKPAPARRMRPVWIFLGALLLVAIAGSAAGYFSGRALRAERETTGLHAYDVEQYLRANDDMLAGGYKAAIQRLEAILQNEPDFPGASQLREQALAALNATPTPLPTNTPVPSPTPDAPRAEQLLAQAKQQFTDKNYLEMINTLLTLKVDIPGYQPERVDGLLWVALRSNGVLLIKTTNRLTEGLYYLDLAANYAPLDKEALDQMEFVRVFLALYQSAYYYQTKDIEESLKYFEQVVAMRRYYSDNLVRDFADILVQNGDALKYDNACAAWGYYERALAELPNHEGALAGLEYAKQNCDRSEPVPIETPVPTVEETPTP